MEAIKAYPTKFKKLSGTKYSEVYKKAFKAYKKIKNQTKRRPYIRSTYFKKDKIFLGLFWHHLDDKLNMRDKIRRLKYFTCAIDLIRHSHFDPVSKENVDRKYEILHRFMGSTSENEIFFVQIKENKRTGQKYFLSVFPLIK